MEALPEIYFLESVVIDVGFIDFDRLKFNNIPFDELQDRIDYLLKKNAMKMEKVSSLDAEKPLAEGSLDISEHDSAPSAGSSTSETIQASDDFIILTKETDEGKKLITIKKIAVDEETYEHMDKDSKIPAQYKSNFFGYTVHHPTVHVNFEHLGDEPMWSFEEIKAFIGDLETIGVCHPYKFITEPMKGRTVQVMLEKPKKCKVIGNKNEIYLRYGKEKHVLDSIE